MEALLLFFALPRFVKGARGVVYLAVFWATATMQYFGNCRLLRWLRRSR